MQRTTQHLIYQAAISSSPNSNIDWVANRLGWNLIRGESEAGAVTVH